MDSTKFLSEWARMCRTHKKVSCRDCPLYYEGDCPYDYDDLSPSEYDMDGIHDCVVAWSEANPVKTHKMDFLEKFPKARARDDGTPRFCRKHLYQGNGCCLTNTCADCWDMPMEDTNA